MTRATTLTTRGVASRLAIAAVLLAFATACAKPAPSMPATPGPAPGPATAPTNTGVPPPPGPPGLPPSVPSVPPEMTADPNRDMAVDDINKDSPLKPVFFVYDSDELDDAARQVLSDNAAVLRQYTGWVITIEGHCDERGTPEYNLALGDRRALAAKTYLQSLGISASRLHTVSYGKEFPFDPGHDDTAWTVNRRAHLMVTATK
jgi:peptidoglycan-associated lipoprotein